MSRHPWSCSTGRTGALVVTSMLLSVALFAGCSKALKVATGIAAEQGVITAQQKGSIDTTAEAFRASFEDLTEEEEYYIGRAVAANLLSRFARLRDPALEAYVNRVGRAVVAASSRPEIYGGYHFAVLDADEVNAFATPGGFIFLTRGMLELVPSEDALAAVLAHEVAHVAAKHGLAAINKNRLLEAFSVLGQEAGREWDRAELRKLVDLYDGAVGDIVKTLVERGYSRSQEEEADRLAVGFAAGIGYRADGLAQFLAEMAARPGVRGEPGMFRTHPPAAERRSLASAAAADHSGTDTDPSARVERFRTRTASVRTAG